MTLLRHYTDFSLKVHRGILDSAQVSNRRLSVIFWRKKQANQELAMRHRSSVKCAYLVGWFWLACLWRVQEREGWRSCGQLGLIGWLGRLEQKVWWRTWRPEIIIGRKDGREERGEAFILYYYYRVIFDRNLFSTLLVLSCYI